jgi:hypothetical protein
VVVQRPCRLGGHGVGQAGVADLDHGFEGMCEAAEVAALSFGEFHCTIVNARPASRGRRTFCRVRVSKWVLGDLRRLAGGGRMV